MLTASNLFIYLDAGMFLVGLLTFLMGVFTLSARTASNEVKSLAAQTARLAHKGLAEDVAGLVGNATSLLDAMNQLVKTTRGVGMMLALFGLSLMGLSTWFAMQIYLRAQL
jgi:hypothetical protein